MKKIKIQTHHFVRRLFTIQLKGYFSWCNRHRGYYTCGSFPGTLKRSSLACLLSISSRGILILHLFVNVSIPLLSSTLSKREHIRKWVYNFTLWYFQFEFYILKNSCFSSVHSTNFDNFFLDIFTNFFFNHKIDNKFLI